MSRQLQARMVEIPAYGGQASGAKARPQNDRRKRRPTGCDARKLEGLVSIGPAMVRDFEMLGIRSVVQLAKQDPRRMYEELGRLTGQRQDPCVLDTFCAAVAQARDPRLPAEKCQWWWWSRKRKSTAKSSQPTARGGKAGS